MLVRHPADRKISGIAVLFQPDPNARAESAKRKGVTTSNNPREIIYPREIWSRREKETGKKEKGEGEYTVEIHTYGYSRRKSRRTSLYKWDREYW